MSATGNRGKFSERLKKILFSRKKKLIEADNTNNHNNKSVKDYDNMSKKDEDSSQNINKTEFEDSNKIYLDFVKVVSSIPNLVYANVFDYKYNEKNENSIMLQKDNNVTLKKNNDISDDENVVFKKNNSTNDDSNSTLKKNNVTNDDNKDKVVKESLNKENKIDGIVSVSSKTHDEQGYNKLNTELNNKKNIVYNSINKSIDENYFDNDNKIIKSNNDIINQSNNVEKLNSKNDVTDNELKEKNQNNVKEESINELKQKNKKIINDIDIELLKKKQELFYNDIKSKDSVENSNLNLSEDNKSVSKVKELEKSIINIIKKNLIKTVNEMEILQSELYILSEVNGDSTILEKCQNELNQVKNILCKIDKLKEQYDFLRDNFDFEYLLEIDDNTLVDKIIELKDTFGKNQLRALSEDYKLLDVYKYLYLKLDNLQEKTSEFEEFKKNEIIKLKERDIDFEKLKNDVYNVESTNNRYEIFVNDQNDLLKKIDENVSKISSYEQIDYHLKGFNQLFRNSFKYFGLLMVSPLKGVIPSIATETLLTGNLIKNLYKNLKWEESRKMVYEAVDYSSIINDAINDLEITGNIVDATLEDIVRLKMKYNDVFKKYQGDFSEYRDIMHKISDMENKILGNKIKIELMKKRTLDQKKENEKKLVLVKELNS